MALARRFVPAGVCLLIAGWLLLARGDEGHVRRAAQLGAAGDYRAAAAEAGRVRRRPAAATAWVLRGRALAGAHDFPASAAAYARAARLEPRDWALRREYARVLLALGRRADARGQMAASLALNPRQSLPAGFVAR
jgi:cytochrome c-type biogenesis protein CcmH/NrfG